MADWTCHANEALTLSLVRSQADKESHADDESYEEFHPTFTYPIYGEDEKLYGYKDLIIDLRFASGSLVQYLKVKFTEKLGSSSTIDDVEGTLSHFIPSGYYKDETEFLAIVEEDAFSFRPPGQLIHSYTRPSSNSIGKRNPMKTRQLDTQDADSVTFEVYHATWETPGFREYHRRMQLFILLYIEGGSYVDENEETWEFMLLYEKRKRRATPDVAAYHFIGYSSLYPFYFFPEKTRMRLSQFVILPPYQHRGLGSELYKAIYRYILLQQNIAELTVEDPAEAFEDLRDVNDLAMLLANENFMADGFGEAHVSHGGGRVGGIGRVGKSGRGGALTSGTNGKMGPPTDKVWSEKWRTKLKIAGRQFQRLIEMLILLRLDLSDPHQNRAYRLQVKERLYRFNFELLVQLEKQERLCKLEETFQSVQEDYLRILSKVR